MHTMGLRHAKSFGSQQKTKCPLELHKRLQCLSLSWILSEIQKTCFPSSGEAVRLIPWRWWRRIIGVRVTRPDVHDNLDYCAANCQSVPFPLWAQFTSLSHWYWSRRWNLPRSTTFSNATSAGTLGVLTSHGSLALPLHSTDAPPWEEHTSGSFYCVSPGPGTNTQACSLEPRQLPLLPRPEPPCLDQPNHSQPAQCEQKDKWGGFLCSNIVEITDQCKV